MFDSHCHLQDLPAQAVDAAVKRARAAGVQRWLLAGVDVLSWDVQSALAARYPECLLSFGIHPQLVAEQTEGELLAMLLVLGERLTQSQPCCAAIGETGLDRGKPALTAHLELQKRLFREQLGLSRALELPVVLHVVDAHALVLEVLRADGVPKCGGVLHSYSGPAELVRNYESLGLCISFSGSICNPVAKRSARAVAAVDAARLLVETDAPYQTPMAHRPQANEIAYLPTVIQRMAELRGQSFEHIAELTDENARRLFNC